MGRVKLSKVIQSKIEGDAGERKAFVRTSLLKAVRAADLATADMSPMQIARSLGFTHYKNPAATLSRAGIPYKPRSLRSAFTLALLSADFDLGTLTAPQIALKLGFAEYKTPHVLLRTLGLNYHQPRRTPPFIDALVSSGIETSGLRPSEAGKLIGVKAPPGASAMMKRRNMPYRRQGQDGTLVETMRRIGVNTAQMYPAEIARSIGVEPSKHLSETLRRANIPYKGRPSRKLKK